MEVVSLRLARMVDSFSFSLEDKEIVDAAKKLASGDGKPFSELVMSLLKQEVHSRKPIEKLGKRKVRKHYIKRFQMTRPRSGASGDNQMTSSNFSIERWIAEQLKSGDFSDMIDFFTNCDLDQLETFGRHLNVMKDHFNKRLACLQKERRMRGDSKI